MHNTVVMGGVGNEDLDNDRGAQYIPLHFMKLLYY